MNDSQQPSFYERTRAALEAGKNQWLENALFAFEIDDREYIERVAKAVRTLLQRPDLTPRQLVSIGRMLFGLSRMPLRTPGLNVRISLVSTPPGWVLAYSVRVSEAAFITESGGSDNFSLGSDAFDGSIFSVDKDSRQYGYGDIRAEHWPDVFFRVKAARLKIEDTSDDHLLDWEAPDGAEFWGWIGKN
jgi:hypothetical protein